MKNLSRCKIIRIHGSSKTYAEEQLPTIPNYISEQADSTKAAKHFSNNPNHDSDTQGKGIMSPGRVSESTKGKMSLRKRICIAGRVERLFRKSFPTVNKEEILLGAHKCSIFTTAGPIKGRIFITSERIAFRSRKLLKVKTFEGEVAKFPYKVSIPLRKIKMIVLSENLNAPEEKYVEIVTVDEFEFWLMGFVNYQRSFDSLHLATYGEQ